MRRAACAVLLAGLVACGGSSSKQHALPDAGADGDLYADGVTVTLNPTEAMNACLDWADAFEAKCVDPACAVGVPDGYCFDALAEFCYTVRFMPDPGAFRQDCVEPYKAHTACDILFDSSLIPAPCLLSWLAVGPTR